MSVKHLKSDALNIMFTSVAYAIGPSVTMSSTDFSKHGFLEFIWIFSGRNHLKINISHILNPILKT